jgi:hypothetical protein
MSDARMPRPRSPNVVQVTVLIPEDVSDRAEALGERMAPAGVTLSRAEVLRAAILRGLDALEADSPPEGKRRRGG